MLGRCARYQLEAAPEMGVGGAGDGSWGGAPAMGAGARGGCRIEEGQHDAEVLAAEGHGGGAEGHGGGTVGHGGGAAGHGDVAGDLGLARRHGWGLCGSEEVEEKGNIFFR